MASHTEWPSAGDRHAAVHVADVPATPHAMRVREHNKQACKCPTCRRPRGVTWGAWLPGHPQDVDPAAHRRSACSCCVAGCFPPRVALGPLCPSAEGGSLLPGPCHQLLAGPLGGDVGAAPGRLDLRDFIAAGVSQQTCLPGGLPQALREPCPCGCPRFAGRVLKATRPCLALAWVGPCPYTQMWGFNRQAGRVSLPLRVHTLRRHWGSWGALQGYRFFCASAHRGRPGTKCFCRKPFPSLTVSERCHVTVAPTGAAVAGTACCQTRPCLLRRSVASSARRPWHRRSPRPAEGPADPVSRASRMHHALPEASAFLSARKAAHSSGKATTCSAPRGERGTGGRKGCARASCSGEGTRAGRACLTCRSHCGAEEDPKEAGRPHG